MLLQELMLKITSLKEIGYKRIGGGYYADVYRFDYPKNEIKIVKVYKTKGIMQREISQIEMLSKHSLFPMPKILFTYSADEKFTYDFVVMEFLDGKNAGEVFFLNKSRRKSISNQVVDNLLSFHNVHNKKGFGEFGSEKYYKTFNEYYKIRCLLILKKATELNVRGELPASVYDIMREATERFEEIFYLPITESSLIHGDYNMFNILIDKKRCKITAIIDPCGAMWGDNEFDLYQLNNANGKHYNLFENYASKKKLTENFREKIAFYELFTEVEHYYNSGYPVKLKHLKKSAEVLKLYLTE